MKVYNPTTSALARGTGIKITGTYTDPVNGRSYPSVAAATAADSGINSVNVLITMETIQPASLGEAIDDGVLIPYDVSALGGLGSDVYLSDTGTLASTPGTVPIRVGEVTALGNAGSVEIGDSRSTVQAASGASTGGPNTFTSGAITASERSSLISVTGTVAFSLADGTFIGQRKTMRCTVAGGTPHGTVTPTTPKGFSTVEFNGVNQTVELEWAQPGASNTKGWYIVGVSGTPTIT